MSENKFAYPFTPSNQKSTSLIFVFVCLIISIFLQNSASAQAFGNEWIDYNKSYYKFFVYPNGNTLSVGNQNNNNDNKANFNQLHRIPYSTLLANGLSNTPAEDFQLWRNGEEVPIYTSIQSGLLGVNDYIEFWGEINDGKPDLGLYKTSSNQMNGRWNLFTDIACHYLTVNAGQTNKRLIPTPNKALTSALTANSFFMHTIKVNYRNARYLGFGQEISGQVVRSSSFDLGEGWSSNGFFPINGSVNTPLNDLKVFRKGPPMQAKFTASGDKGFTRTIQFLLNDSIIYNQRISRLNAVNTPLINNIPFSRISQVSSGDSVAIKFISPNNPAPNSDRIIIVSAEITYPRLFSFNSDFGFEFQLPANTNGNLLKIKDANLNNGSLPILIDLTNLFRIEAINVGSEFWFELPPSAVARRLVFTNTLNNAGPIPRTITTLEKKTFKSYKLTPANYLIISNSKLFNSGGNNYVQQYADYRASATGGDFKTGVFDVEDMYDQFSYGIRKHPLAVRNFIRYANDNFRIKPKYVFIIGKAVVYNNFLMNDNTSARSEEQNLVPTWGNPASDNMLAADASNINTIPKIPIGRLAAINGNEVNDYLEKVKEFEQLEKSTQGKPWQKTVLQLIGGSDPSIVSGLNQYMANYKAIISDTFASASVKSFTRINDPNTSANNDTIQQSVSNGTGLVSYFGHSSTTTLDFNLNEPNELGNSAGKYPVFLVNGCNASEFFNYNPNRLVGGDLTLSEKFILAKQKGAIAFMSSSHFGVLQYLNVFAENWYKAASYRQYAKGIGNIMQDAIEQMNLKIGNNNYYARLTSEEFVLHGDPSVKLYSFQKPDFIIDSSSISFQPNVVTTATDSLQIQLKIYNSGLSNSKPVWLHITKTTPDKTQKFIFKQQINNLNNERFVVIKIPLFGDAEKGWNVFTATIDAEQDIDEYDENNNSWTDSILISNSDLIPIIPYTYSIINDLPIQFIGSAVNVLSENIDYRFQIDTTEKFNSSLLKSLHVNASGGTVYFNPSLNSLLDSTVYYWRLAPLTFGVPGTWHNSSFIYLPNGTEGFDQSHYFQHLKSTFTNIALNQANRNFYFDSTRNNLYITQGIYPTSGTEDSHFSIAQNGDLKMFSACLGQSIIFNVFDSTSFTPWQNTTGNRFGSGPNSNCANGRQYNFEFKYYPASQRRKIMDFMDSIPKGMIVTARLVLDPDNGQPGFNANTPGKADSALAKNWMKDTIFFGKNNSLYHYFVKQGFYNLNELNDRKTFGFVFKKDDSLTFKPKAKLSNGLFDRAILSADFNMTDTSGIIKSPVFGPATNWYELHWRGHPFANNNSNTDTITVTVIGIKSDGTEDVLKCFNKQQQDVDISDINASTYPNLKLQLNNSSPKSGLPYQLDYWRLNYDPIPEGAVAPELYYDFNKNTTTQIFKDTLLAGTDTLFFGVAFKNISQQAFQNSMVADVRLYDSLDKEVFQATKYLKTLAVGDTLKFLTHLNIDTLYGKYNLKINFNPNKLQKEKSTDNNFIVKSFYVAALEGRAAPDLYVNFKKDPISNQLKDTLLGYIDSLMFGVAFKNTSILDFKDSINVEFVISDELSNVENIIQQPKQRRLPAADTLHFNYKGALNTLDGWNNIRLTFNPNNTQREQTLANNSYLKRFYVDQSPEALMDSALYYNFTRSVVDNNKFTDTLLASVDDLKFGIAIKNAGRKNFNESLPLKFELISDGGKIITIPANNLKALVSGDTAMFNYQQPSTTLNGWYTLKITVNPNGTLREQTRTNNSFTHRFFVYNIVLPVNFVSFTARPQNQNVLLNWTAANEINFDKYMIEHSTNGSSFANIGSVNSKQNTAATDYNFLHTKPIIGNNYYRLKITNNNGTLQYSGVKMINFQNGFSVQALPNPFKQNLKLIVTGDDKPVTITILNTIGQVLYQQKISQLANINTTAFAAGVYYIKVQRSNGEQIQLMLEKQ